MAIEDLLSQGTSEASINPWLSRAEQATPAPAAAAPAAEGRNLEAELDALKAQLEVAQRPSPPPAQMTPQDISAATAWGVRSALTPDQVGPQIQLPPRPAIEIGDELLEPKVVARMIQEQADWAFQAAHQAAMQQVQAQYAPAIQQLAMMAPHVQGSWEQAARMADAEARQMAIERGIPAEEFDQALPTVVGLLQQNSGPAFATRRTDPNTLSMLVNMVRINEGKPVPVQERSSGSVSIGVNGGAGPSGSARSSLTGERAAVARRVQEILGVQFNADDLAQLGAV
ncbi:MAG TPA: hypothetical protein DEH78_18985 [Solibacterales bacterium]|nr:hypothetical protein [Bryobacterales bacterium]